MVDQEPGVSVTPSKEPTAKCPYLKALPAPDPNKSALAHMGSSALVRVSSSHKEVKASMCPFLASVDDENNISEGAEALDKGTQQTDLALLIA